MNYLLAGITVTDSLADNVVLKGGTALRKSYFKDYRFSEDLDFSTLKLGEIPDLEEKIEAPKRALSSLKKQRLGVHFRIRTGDQVDTDAKSRIL